MPTQILDRLGSPAANPGSALRVVPIYDEAELPQGRKFLGRPWPNGCPFAAGAWNECWWRHYRGPHDRLNVLSLEDRDGNIRGLAPWYIGHFAVAGSSCAFSGRRRGVFRTSDDPLRSDLAILGGQHAGRLAQPGRSPPLGYARTGRHRLRQHGGSRARVRTDPAATSDPCTHSINAWRVNLPKTWDEYLAQFSSRRRERLQEGFSA